MHVSEIDRMFDHAIIVHTDLPECTDLIDVTDHGRQQGYKVDTAISSSLKDALDSAAMRFKAGSWLNLIDALLIVTKRVYLAQAKGRMSPPRADFTFCGLFVYALVDCDGVTLKLDGED